MNETKQISTQVARHLAEQYGKAIVVIVAYDESSELLYTTTYGIPTNPEYKDIAAEWGDLFSAVLGTDQSKRQTFSDFRASDKAEDGSRIELLTKAINQIDTALRVPAAEYVPAIRDVFNIIDNLKQIPFEDYKRDIQQYEIRLDGHSTTFPDSGEEKE